jgi:Aspartyl protease
VSAGAQKPSHSFTVKSTNGFLGVLITDCHVCLAHDSSAGPSSSNWCTFKAIWDTGASATVITAAVAQACGLKPIGKTIVHGVGGQHVCNVYLVNIRLPNQVAYKLVRVTEGILPGGNNGDVLIGMDIITTGDFAVTNLNGSTTFSFRHPSSATVDYVQQHHSKMKLGKKAYKNSGKRG